MKKLIYKKHQNPEAAFFSSEEELLNLMKGAGHVFVKDKFDEFYYMVYNEGCEDEKFTLFAKNRSNNLIDMDISFDKVIEFYQVYMASEEDLLRLFEKTAK